MVGSIIKDVLNHLYIKMVFTFKDHELSKLNNYLSKTNFIYSKEQLIEISTIQLFNFQTIT